MSADRSAAELRHDLAQVQRELGSLQKEHAALIQRLEAAEKDAALQRDLIGRLVLERNTLKQQVADQQALQAKYAACRDATATVLDELGDNLCILLIPELKSALSSWGKRFVTEPVLGRVPTICIDLRSQFLRYKELPDEPRGARRQTLASVEAHLRARRLPLLVRVDGPAYSGSALLAYDPATQRLAGFLDEGGAGG
jgi:hypothetical protein